MCRAHTRSEILLIPKIDPVYASHLDQHAEGRFPTAPHRSGNMATAKESRQVWTDADCTYRGAVIGVSQVSPVVVVKGQHISVILTDSMPKSSAAKKRAKNAGVGIDFKKARHKVGKRLPKAKNDTNTNFKSRAISLADQNIGLQKGAIVSDRNLTLKVLSCICDLSTMRLQTPFFLDPRESCALAYSLSNMSEQHKQYSLYCSALLHGRKTRTSS